MLYSPSKLVAENMINEELFSKRIRIPVKIVYRNHDVAQELTKYILMLRGVVQCKANK